MARKYNSSRRDAAAQQTREDILAAAFKLHGLGILDTESLARQANVSVATVRKHFPTRELLFENCTAYGMHLVPPPDIATIAATADAAERTRIAVREVYALQEQLLGQMWSAYKLEHESPALAAVLAQSDQISETVADLVLAAWFEGADVPSEARGFLLALLSPLTYRALRRHGGLSPQQAVERTSVALVGALSVLSGKEGAYA